MELKETCEMMVSDDYKERFRAEYYQAKIRQKKLRNLLDLWNNGELTFTPSCPKDLLEEQELRMDQYILILEKRAKIEGVNLCLS